MRLGSVFFVDFGRISECSGADSSPKCEHLTGFRGFPTPKAGSHPRKKYFGRVPATFGGVWWWRLLATNFAGFGRYVSPQTLRYLQNGANHTGQNLFSPRQCMDPKVYQFSAPNSNAKVLDREWYHLRWWHLRSRRPLSRPLCSYTVLLTVVCAHGAGRNGYQLCRTGAGPP